MDRSRKPWVYGVVSVMGVLWLAGCASSGSPPTPHDDGALRSEVEQLYLDYHELKVIHGDLHEAALRHMERGGGQLSEIQSAARFIDQANLIAYYQWQLLSITAYIRDGARADFFSLRLRDIDDARQKSEDLIVSIRVYEAFLDDPEAQALIERAIGHIQQNVNRYHALDELMRPLANPPAPLPVSASEDAI